MLVMDDICAARALSWYRELDRELRSSKAGGQCEAIMNLAPRLLKWSLEPPLSQPAANLWKLDRDQDKSYANAIFLRLGELFVLGNNAVRLCILKVLLHVYQGHKKEVGSLEGCLLAQKRIPSYAEVVKRVKGVVEAGDVTARCLGLRALGCLAEMFSGDLSECSFVLGKLESEHKQEFEAALFLAGCLCELSAPFASLCLEKVVDLAGALKTQPETRILLLRLLSKMWVSADVAVDAHKAGQSLMLKFPSASIVETALEALTTLAISSTPLLSHQARLLLNYVGSDLRASVKLQSLICLRQLFLSAPSSVEIMPEALGPLFSLIANIGEAPSLRLQTLCVLERALPFHKSEEQVGLVELSALDPDWSVGTQSLRVLVKLACITEGRQKQGRGRSDMLVDDPVGVDYAARVALLLCDRIALARPGDVQQSNDCRSLTTKLAAGSRQASGVLTECISQMIEAIVTEGTEAVADVRHDASKVTLLCRCLLPCLELGDYPARKTYLRLLHVAELLSASPDFDDISASCLPALVTAAAHRTEERAEGYTTVMRHSDRLLEASKFWASYKLAINSCCCGLWTVGEKLFSSLSDKVSSDNYYFWLKALSHLCSAESILSNSAGTGTKLLDAGSQSLRLFNVSIRTLEAGFRASRPFDFQKKVLQLRIQLLQAVMDVLLLCESIQRMQGADSTALNQFISACSGKAEMLVHQLQILAEQFYVVTMSFMDVDGSTLQILYVASSLCSLVAFCAAQVFSSSKCSRLRCQDCPGCFTFKVDLFERARAFSGGFSELVNVLTSSAAGSLRFRMDVPWLRMGSPAAGLIRKTADEVQKLKCEFTPGSLQTGVPFLRRVCERVLCSSWRLPKLFFRISPVAHLDLVFSQEIQTSDQAAPHPAFPLSADPGHTLRLSLGFQVNSSSLKLKRLSCLLAPSDDLCSSCWPEDIPKKDMYLLKWLALRSNTHSKKFLQAEESFISVPLQPKVRAFCSVTLTTTGPPPTGDYDLCCIAIGVDTKGHRWVLPCTSYRTKSP